MNFTDINPRLCNFCGTCAGFCPVNAIKIKDVSLVFDDKICIKCGKCYDFCQGIRFDFRQARGSFKREKFDSAIGGYKEIYSCQSKDEALLETSSSGGLVPEFMIYALEKKIISGVIMLVKDKDDPLGYRIAIARNRKGVLERATSLYRYIPLNSVLKKIKDEKDLGFIGLPCHVEGIRKLQMAGEIKNIKLVAGIFCGLNQDKRSVDFLLKKLHVKPDDVSEFSQRKKDFDKDKFSPGYFYVKTKKGKEYFLSKHYYNFLHFKDAKERCFLCYDYTNEFSDISFGDGWSGTDKRGCSDVIVRSKEAEEIFNGLIESGRIVAEKIDIPTVTRYHPGHYNLKKKYFFIRYSHAKEKPDYNLEFPEETVKRRIIPVFSYYGIKVLRSGAVKWLFNVLPLWMTAGSLKLMSTVLKRVVFKKR